MRTAAPRRAGKRRPTDRSRLWRASAPKEKEFGFELETENLVTRHGGPGPDDQAYAQSLGEGLLRTISFLEEAPEVFDGALDTGRSRSRSSPSTCPSISFSAAGWASTTRELTTVPAQGSRPMRPSRKEVPCRF